MDPALVSQRVRRHYPADTSEAVTLPDGSPLVIRSIRPSDTVPMAVFHTTLSEDTVRSRYFHLVGLHARIAEARLARICRPDTEVEAVLVATVPAAAPGSPEAIVGVGRLEEMNPRSGEVALLISDAWQHHGVGAALLTRLIALARGKGLEELHAYILPGNVAMQRLCERFGFTVGFSTAAGTLHARLPLAAPKAAG